MEHNLYDNDTDDDSDTLIMDLSDICDKSYDSEEENETAAPNDTAYKRWSCHSELKLLCKLCRTSLPPAMGARFTVFGGMRTRWMAGAVAHKSV